MLLILFLTKTDDFLEEKKKGRAKGPPENRVFLLRRGRLRAQDGKKTSRSFGNKKAWFPNRSYRCTILP